MADPHAPAVRSHHQMAREIRTERLHLRPPCADDLEAVFTVHADPRTWRHRPDLVMTSREEAADLLGRWGQDWDDHGIGYFVVRTLDGRTIGFTGLRRSTVDDQDVLNLYYRFAPEAQGRGYAREAVRAAIDWARASRIELPIVAVVAPNNPASARLATALGLVRDPAGTTCDHDLYRLEL